jgi:hypothetical protein
MLPNTQKRLNFDPTINLGHIITAATFLVVGTAGYVALDGRVGNLERSYRDEQAVRLAADASVEARLLVRVSENRAQVEASQLRLTEDIREIKTLMREGFRDLDLKIEKKAEKPPR